jgi:hypothetical protein
MRVNGALEKTKEMKMKWDQMKIAETMTHFLNFVVVIKPRPRRTLLLGPPLKPRHTGWRQSR